MLNLSRTTSPKRSSSVSRTLKRRSAAGENPCQGYSGGLFPGAAAFSYDPRRTFHQDDGAGQRLLQGRRTRCGNNISGNYQVLIVYWLTHGSDRIIGASSVLRDHTCRRARQVCRGLPRLRPGLASRGWQAGGRENATSLASIRSLIGRTNRRSVRPPHFLSLEKGRRFTGLEATPPEAAPVQPPQALGNNHRTRVDPASRAEVSTAGPAFSATPIDYGAAGVAPPPGSGCVASSVCASWPGAAPHLKPPPALLCTGALCQPGAGKTRAVEARRCWSAWASDNCASIILPGPMDAIPVASPGISPKPSADSAADSGRDRRAPSRTRRRVPGQKGRVMAAISIRPRRDARKRV